MAGGKDLTETDFLAWKAGHFTLEELAGRIGRTRQAVHATFKRRGWLASGPSSAPLPASSAGPLSSGARKVSKARVDAKKRVEPDPAFASHASHPQVAPCTPIGAVGAPSAIIDVTAENLEEMLYSTGVKVLTDLHSGRVGASAAKAAAAALGSLHELFLRLGTLAKPEDRPADLHISIMTEAEEAEAQRRASAGDDEIEGGECEILEPGWSPPVMNEADEARVRAAVEGVAESAAEASRNGESSSELPPHRHEAEQPSPFIGSPPAPICPPFLPGPLPERERFRNWLDYVAKRNGNSALRQVLRYGLGRSVGNQTPRSELIDEIIGATGGDPSRLAAFVIGE